MPPRPRVPRTPPPQSPLPLESPRLISATRRKSIVSTAAAIGTLMKNIHLHETFSMSHPPSTGPNAVVIAENADHVPIALPLSPGLKKTVIIERLPGMRSAPPPPRSPRHTLILY